MAELESALLEKGLELGRRMLQDEGRASPTEQTTQKRDIVFEQAGSTDTELLAGLPELASEALDAAN
jgi:hypothetical protein